MNPDERTDLDQPSDAGAHEIGRLLDEPQVRARLTELLREALTGQQSTWRRVWPLLVSAGSALVMLLAFFIPSIQEQWDRFQARRVIERYVELGRSFMDEGRYDLAEESFAKAFELSESRRLDIEEARLKAKVLEINANPDWGAESPEGLDESDFLYLLQMQRGPAHALERAVTFNSYGAFLAAAKHWREAEDAIREALRLNPSDAAAYVNLGNLMRDLERQGEAEAAYRAALRLDSEDARVHYDLGLVLAETGRPKEAEEAFRQAVALDPDEADLLRALGTQLRENGKVTEARDIFERLRRLEAAGGNSPGG